MAMVFLRLDLRGRLQVHIRGHLWRGSCQVDGVVELSMSLCLSFVRGARRGHSISGVHQCLRGSSAIELPP